MALDKYQIASANVEQGQNVKTFFTVAGVIRNTGAGFFWINDVDHEPLNVDIATITTSATEVTIHFKQTASKVISLVVCPDETYSIMGIFCGASVDLDKARISFANSGGLVDPTTLTSANGNFWVYGIFLQ